MNDIHSCVKDSDPKRGPKRFMKDSDPNRGPQPRRNRRSYSGTTPLRSP
jgi:hypothetical protein